MDSMHPNAQLIREFYAAFNDRDAARMAACYHPDVRFSDEVFVDLDGPRAAGMWRMLCERAGDLRIVSSDIEADESTGSAHWEAWYTFSPTGRPVHNRIDARFGFQGGLIIRHRDSFGFWRWASQALGPLGSFLGWTPFVRNRVRSRASRNLDGFLRGQGRGDTVA